MANDAENLFMWLTAICVSFLDNSYLEALSIFKLLFAFLLSSGKSSSYVLDTNSLSNMLFANILSE